MIQESSGNASEAQSQAPHLEKSAKYSMEFWAIGGLTPLSGRNESGRIVIWANTDTLHLYPVPQCLQE